jgi:hypothetical protein
MARTCRDGQKKLCSIYRLLTLPAVGYRGLIDEKMFQRQLYIESTVGFVGQSSNQAGTLGGVGRTYGKTSGLFSQQELKRLFDLNLETECGTRDILAGRLENANHMLEWGQLIRVDVIAIAMHSVCVG